MRRIGYKPLRNHVSKAELTFFLIVKLRRLQRHCRKQVSPALDVWVAIGYVG